MIGDHDRVSANLHSTTRISGAHNTLEAKDATPILAQLLRHLPVHPDVEHRIEIAGDRNRFASALPHVRVEIGQNKFIAEEIIQRPARLARIGQR